MLRESDIHSISPETLAPQYQPIKKKGKVFYGQEPPIGGSTEVNDPQRSMILPQRSMINYLQKCTEAAQWGTPSCSQPLPATDNGVRDGRSN